MRVAIDSGPLSGGHSIRGIGHVVKNLIDSLQKYNNDKNIKIEPVDYLTADLSQYDILHYTTFNPYFLNYPRIGTFGSKIILTIHDLIPLIYQNQYPPGYKGLMRYQINKLFVKKADMVITASETAKKDIVRFLGIDPKKIKVIYWAADDIYKESSNVKALSDVRDIYKLPKKFVLYVGDVNYNKNLPILIEACSIIDVPLVLVGKQASKIDELTLSWKNISGPRDMVRSLFGKSHPELAHFEKLLSLIRSNNVITVGFVPASDIVAIYNLASVYCQPSYYEGFGLPVLEAFSCGVPVVISKTQALVELAKGGALIADPNSAEDFAEKISSLLKDSTDRLHLIRAGKTRSKEFLWEKTARNTIEVYKHLVDTKDNRQ
jgi:glycosyltransferase involved in cell wall biosynthesis